MKIKLQCNKCNSLFEIIFENKNTDNSYYAVCPCCGNSGYKQLKEIEVINNNKDPEESEPNKEKFNNISKERMEELEHYFWEETSDEDSQELRKDLIEEERKLISEWDEKFNRGMAALGQELVKKVKK